MSFCCPSGYGCNHVQGRGVWTVAGECYRSAVRRCVDQGLADLAEAWAVRHDEAPWWRPDLRLRYARSYRRAVLMAYDAGIRPLMIRLPRMTGLPRSVQQTRALIGELDDVDRRLRRDDMTDEVRADFEHRRALLRNALDPDYRPPEPPSHPIPNPPRPSWVLS